jgi:hypothetical protein
MLQHVDSVTTIIQGATKDIEYLCMYNVIDMPVLDAL